MISLEGGQYRKFKSKNPKLCDCTVGVDPNSHQPHLLRCKNTAQYLWFSRHWFLEITKESTEPIFFNIPAIVCESCLERLKLTKPPSDLDKYRELHKKNKNAVNP
jgi:hypothetical protein